MTEVTTVVCNSCASNVGGKCENNYDAYPYAWSCTWYERKSDVPVTIVHPPVSLRSVKTKKEVEFFVYDIKNATKVLRYAKLP